MQTHPQLICFSMAHKSAPRTQTHSGVALFIATLTILIALVALAPVAGIGQPFGRSSHPGNRLQAKGSISGSSQPSAPLFRPAVAYDSGGQYAESAIVADVNGDGKPDLIVANYCNSACTSGSVGVLLGNGDGTFRAAVAYDSGGRPIYKVRVADVNGDGRPDILVANFGSGTVGVLLGRGDGTFEPAVTYNSGANPSDIAVADVNGDGRPDLLVPSDTFTGGTLNVMLGNGDGTFQPPVSYGSGPGVPLSVAVADVNGDGRPDLLVANDGGTVSVLLGNGDGTFQPAVTYSSGGFTARSVAVADVNRDGKLDLVVANGASTVGVLLGKGDGTFQPAVTYSSGGATDTVAVADLNGDGTPDLALSIFCGPSDCTKGSVGLVSVLLGNGDGTFQAQVTYASGGRASTSIAVADVNGDGEPDLIAANGCGGSALCEGSVGVLLNNAGVPHPTSISLISGLNPSTYGQTVTWTAAVTTSGPITPTGHVSFTWGGIHIIGSGTLNSGVATLTKSNLNADTYPLTAVYGGDADNLASTSAVLNQVVLETTSAATLTSSPNPSTQGQAVTFTAKITSPTVTPTGPVTFTLGKTVLGTAQLSGGKAQLTISSLPVGSTKVTATYYGDSNVAKSSASVNQTVR